MNQEYLIWTQGAESIALCHLLCIIHHNIMLRTQFKHGWKSMLQSLVLRYEPELRKNYHTLALYQTIKRITEFRTGNHIENSPILLSKCSMYCFLQKIAGVKVLIVIEQNNTLPPYWDPCTIVTVLFKKNKKQKLYVRGVPVSQYLQCCMI